MQESEITNPHDKFFKSILSQEEEAKDFLRLYLPPQISRLLDFNSLSIVKDSFIEKELKEYFSDLLYRIDIKKQPGFIYMLFEHKSSPDPLTPFQVLRYMVKIWGLLLKQGEIHRKLPIIIPLVVYHGVSAWKISVKFTDLFHIPDEALEPYIPEFNYLLYDISHLSDEEIKGVVTLRATLLVLKYIFRPDLREKLEGIFGLLRELNKRDTGLEYLESMLRYIVHATDKITREDIEGAIRNIPEGGKIMPTIAEQWKEEGFQKGMQQGLQQGIQQGMQQGLQQGMQQGIQQGMRQGVKQGFLTAIKLGLELRFGAEGLKIYPEIKKIEDSDLLEIISEGIKSAKDIEEVRNIYKE